MSDDNKEGAGVPVAYVVRDAEGGSLHDFTDYYNADQFWIRNRSRMLKPQFLFCYDAPAAAMPAAPSDAVKKLGRRLAELLDEDHWAECEPLLFDIETAPRALVAKWRHAAEHLGLEGLASLSDCADELEAALSQTMQPQAAPSDAVRPCEYCDDTGDVHGLDGEWRGVCICPAGVALAQPAQEVATTPAIPKGDLSKVWQAADDVCEWLNYEVWPEKSPGLKKSVDILNEAMGRAEIRAGRAVKTALASRDEAPATPQAAIPAAPSEVTASERYHWLVENFDVRSLVGVGDLTKLDTFIDGKIHDKRGLVLSRAASGGGVGSDPLAVAALTQPTTVQQEPDPLLIDSMCMRWRHDFGLQRDADDQLSSGLTDAERDSLRSSMRQLWEEVVGHGFYRPAALKGMQPGERGAS